MSICEYTVSKTVKLKTRVDLAASSSLKTFFQKWIWAPVVTSRKYKPLLRLGIGGKAKKRGSGNVIVIGEAKRQRLSPGKWKGKSVSENSGPVAVSCWTLAITEHCWALIPSTWAYFNIGWRRIEQEPRLWSYNSGCIPPQTYECCKTLIIWHSQKLALWQTWQWTHN